MKKVCTPRSVFREILGEIDFEKELVKSDQDLRVRVWDFTPEIIQKLFYKGVNSVVNDENTAELLKSVPIADKLKGLIKKSPFKSSTVKIKNKIASKFRDELLNSKEAIPLAIALNDLLESVKGEYDKAEKNGINILEVSKDGILPNLPAARVAESIGRKIAYQKGVVFSNKSNKKITAVEISEAYYTVGMNYIQKLSDLGYLSINPASSNEASIKDYIDKDKNENITPIKKDDKIVKDIKTLSLTLDSIGTKSTREEDVRYFSNRTEADIKNSPLADIVNALKVFTTVTVKSNLSLPFRKEMTAEQKREKDTDHTPDPIANAVKDVLQSNPLKVNSSMHTLFKNLNKEVLASGTPAIEILSKYLDNDVATLNSLFGIKNSDDLSRDKSESVSGQNKSKTVPFNDFIEHYNVINEDGDSELRLGMKSGRNVRFYYWTSVLNPHSSKHSRYLLTPGEHTSEINSDSYKRVVYQISDSLGLTPEAIMNFDDIEIDENDTDAVDKGIKFFNDKERIARALKLFDTFSDLDNVGINSRQQIQQMAGIAKEIPGVDFASLMTGLKAIQDIRNPNADGTVTTEYAVSSDATASGATLVFLQAIGTNPKVIDLLKRMNIIGKDNANIDIEGALNDVYGLLENSIQDFVDDNEDPRNIKHTGNKSLVEKSRKLINDLKDTVYKDLRDLSKGPTMTFIYGQGETSSIETIGTRIADDLIDNIADPKVLAIIKDLVKDDKIYEDFKILSPNNIEGLYAALVRGVNASGTPKKLYDLLDVNVKEEYLAPYIEDADAIATLVEDLESDFDIDNFKVLPASAAINKTDNKLTEKKYLDKYGMSVGKIYDSASNVNGETIFTRIQKWSRSVMGVSTTHGMDAAQLYTAISKAVVAKSKKDGIVVVHDDLRSNPEIVAAIEVEYIKATKKIAEEYDLHDQMLKSLVLTNPEIVNNISYETIRKKIDKRMEVKKEVLKDFNFSTSSIIGDNKWKSIPENTKVKIPKAKPANKEQLAKGVEALNKKFNGNQLKAGESNLREESSSFKAADLDTLVNEFAEESDIIKMYQESVNKAPISKGNANVFDPEDNLIEISSVDPRRNGGETQDISTPKGRQNVKTLIEHEITHSFTVGFLQKALAEGNDNRVKYVQKAVQKTRDAIFQGKLEGQALERMMYALGKDNEARAINEFVAIMTTEPEVAVMVYEAISENRNKLIEALKYIVKMGEKFIGTITKQDLEKEYVDVSKVQGAMNGIIQDGYSARENQYDSFLEHQKSYMGKVGAGTTNPLKHHGLNYVNYAASTMITTKAERSLISLGKYVNETIENNIPMYAAAMAGLTEVYKDSSALQQLVHTVTNNNIDKKKKNDLLSKMSRLQEERNDLVTNELKKFKAATKNLSKEESNYLYDLIHKAPLHDYFILSGSNDTEVKITQRIAQLEKDLGNHEILAVKSIVRNKIDFEMQAKDANVKMEPGSIYSLDKIINFKNESKMSEAEKDRANGVREYLALKTIEALGTDKFVKMNQNTELMSLVKDNSVANRISTLKIGNTGMVNDSLVPEYYAEPVQKRIIALDELRDYENGNEKGWKVLRTPTKNSLGVVYRPTIDSTYLNGVFTDIRLSSSDIDVPVRYKKYNDAIKSGEVYKLVLTDIEKDTLGLVRDPAESLVRGTVHNIAIQDSQVIRDRLLKEDTTFTVNGKKDSKKLTSAVNSTNVDNPWFVKLNNVNYQDLDDEVKAKYKAVTRSLSDVNGFDKEISLVRKDIAHWLVGDNANSLSENPKFKWVLRITKAAVAGAKLGMVILNPVKIAKDNMSNISYLGVMGVDPLFIGKEYQKISKEFSDYAEIKQSLIQLRIKQASNPEDAALKAKFKNEQKRLVSHPIHSVYKKGFVNSLGTDLIHQNADTLSGMQSDLQKALSYMVKKEDGENNSLGKFISKVSKIGGNGEDLLAYFAKIIGRADSLKGVSKELDSAAARIKEIKTDDDVVNYLSQYMITTESESVKLGSYATDLTDVLAKETYYRYLTQEMKMSDVQATETVIESFPDYKENMPMAVKQLSDMGILMFPAFWMRIQKVIYRMARDKPVNLALELQIENMLNTDLENIIDANIVNKFNEWGGILHSPHEIVGANSVLPYHVL